MAVQAEKIAAGLAAVQARIATAMQEAGRTTQEGSTSDSLALVAISKLQPAEAVHCAALGGQVHFGENYVQEALAKQDELTATFGQSNLRWHFTGHIQSRKAKEVVGRFDLIHTVDSEKLARIIDQCAAQKNIRQAILIQVNVGAEEQKSGVSIEKLSELTKYILSCPHLDLQGLMCLPPVFDAGLAARPHFALLKNLREQLEHEFLTRLREIHGEAQPKLKHLSMGMSGDLEAAIFEGATLVRVGTDIFGARA